MALFRVSMFSNPQALHPFWGLNGGSGFRGVLGQELRAR